MWFGRKWFEKGLHTVLASCIVFGGCQFSEQHLIPKSKLEQSIEDVVTEGINLFNEGKIQEAQSLLEAYRENNRDQFTPSAHTLLALCYVDRINLSNIVEVSEEITGEFKALNNQFKGNPLILLEIQEKFEKLFKTKGYQRVERKIQFGIAYEPALYGALFLLHLSQRKYESARDYAKKFVRLGQSRQLGEFQKVIDEYKKILSTLSGYASTKNDYNTIIGLARVAEAFLIK